MDGSQGARGADTVVVSATSATQRGAIWARQTLDEYPVLITKLGGAMPRQVHVFRSPERFLAGTIGQPGEREFFLQVVDGRRVLSVACEKQQVAVLADRLGSLITEVARRFGAQ